MLERFTDSSRRSIVLSQDKAAAIGATAIGTDHLLYAVATIGYEPTDRLLAAAGLSPDTIDAKLERFPPLAKPPALPFTEEAKTALTGALRLSLGASRSFIDPLSLLGGLLRHRGAASADLVTACGVMPERLYATVVSELSSARSRQRPFGRAFVPTSVAPATSPASLRSAN